MTNCCNAYGDCTQGRDCPARTGVVLPHQARHAKRMQELQDRVADVPCTLSHEPTEPTKPLEDLSPTAGRELLGIVLLAAAFFVLGLVAISMVMGYGWASVGREFMAAMLAGLPA